MIRLQFAVAALVVAIGLGSSPGAGAKEAHSHGEAASQGGGLTLDHGRKWQTDSALRRGMAAIGQDMAGALDRIHGNRFAASDYEALAESLGTRVDDITRNCRLPEAADAQLHVIIAQVMDGIGVMKGQAPDRSRGAVAVVQALDRYQAHFDHPGWRSIAH